MIATSVVEEGVDVDACEFVIVLDNLKTTKSYIQKSCSDIYNKHLRAYGMYQKTMITRKMIWIKNILI